MPASGAPETLVLPIKQYGVTYQNTVIVTATRVTTSNVRITWPYWPRHVDTNLLFVVLKAENMQVKSSGVLGRVVSGYPAASTSGFYLPRRWK